MKQIRFNILLKPIALMLLVTFLIQGCKIYDKSPVTLDQTMDKTRVKIITTDGRTWLFSDIYYKEDSLLYGIISKKIADTKEIIITINQIREQKTISYTNAKTEEFKTFDGEKYVFNSYYYKNDTLYGLQTIKRQGEILIPIETIEEIYLYNSKKSNTGNVFIAVGGVGLFFLGLFIALAIAMSKYGGC